MERIGQFLIMMAWNPFEKPIALGIKKTKMKCEEIYESLRENNLGCEEKV